ncbi:hypothetical protein FHR83_002078 [Actinoplanes campanulatus]|uniref:Uncharacterized protein n=1 Tax=Actinoplanes campanulatus TaxID=113559 RepID=A0A7W5ADQ8_9ACTN|nr:hypothetical protein [Actinoplanes campanulatus]MBB3094426.1 hypothetical protein [Actinoplanes campanulatus]GGN20933.1 hypothetical protein GCM10010109_34890 [Actinoplanes campanulatus]GID35661.1 hypothetical protein Aca09nite_21670 [Actinoplanes campanulatus]
MSFSLLWRHGASSAHDEIPDETLYKLLAELDEGEDAEHGDVWLSEDATGWGIGVFAGDRGLVVLENTESDGRPFHRTGVSRQEAFVLFRRAADGQMAAIRAEPWRPGYGPE